MPVQLRNKAMADLLYPDITSIIEERQASRPMFSAYNSATDTNVTGDGTNYTVICDTEIFDVGSNYNNTTGVFTAPISGYYLLIGEVLLSGIVAGHTVGYVDLVTSNRLYRMDRKNPVSVAAGGWTSLIATAIVDMDASDTAYLRVFVDNGALVVNVYGGASPHTFFQGTLMT